METGAIIVAAGLSQKMKSLKPLLQLSGTTVIQNTIKTLQAVGIKDITVVIGNQADRLSKYLTAMDVTCIMNENYASTDMFESVRIGFKYMQDRFDRILFLPADVPLLSEHSLFAMLGYMECHKCEILTPCYHGKAGHPILLKNTAISKLLAYDGDEGLKGAIDYCDVEKATIQISDIGIILDADDPKDNDLLADYFKNEIIKSPLKCEVYIDIYRKYPFFDMQLYQLLQTVKRFSSLHKACVQMNIAYSTGWKLVKIAEHQLGFSLLNTQTGGAHGGGSTLTEKCNDFIQSYKQFLSNVIEYSDTKFEKYFSDYINNDVANTSTSE